MTIHIRTEEFEEEYRTSWKLEYIKSPAIDYATNAIHGWLIDPMTKEKEDIILFRFKNYGFINDNRYNSYELSVGKAGITIEITKNDTTTKSN